MEDVEYDLYGGNSLSMSSDENINEESYNIIRYDFVPSSLTVDGPGILWVDERNSATAEFLKNSNDEMSRVLYAGKFKEAKTRECILIFDEERGEFRVEMLKGSYSLKSSRDKVPSIPLYDPSSILQLKETLEQKRNLVLEENDRKVEVEEEVETDNASSDMSDNEYFELPGV